MERKYCPYKKCILIEKVDATKQPSLHYFRCPLILKQDKTDISADKATNLSDKVKNSIDFFSEEKKCPDASCRYSSGEYILELLQLSLPF